MKVGQGSTHWLMPAAMRASLRCWKCAWCQNGLIMRILAGGCTRERAQLFGRLSFVCLLGYRWCANHVLHARFFVMININQYFTIWLLFIQPIHISLARVCVHAECNLLIDLFAARARSYFTHRVRCVSRVEWVRAQHIFILSAWFSLSSHKTLFSVPPPGAVQSAALLCAPGVAIVFVLNYATCSNENKAAHIWLNPYFCTTHAHKWEVWS